MLSMCCGLKKVDMRNELREDTAQEKDGNTRGEIGREQTGVNNIEIIAEVTVLLDTEVGFLHMLNLSRISL